LSLNPVDFAILILVLLSAVQGLRTGLIRSVFSLAGLILGIIFASSHYKRFAIQLEPMVHSMAVAETIWFCLLVAAVMILAAVAGQLIYSAFHATGLGGLDRLAGLLFGLLQGAVLATVCIIIVAAFFPDTLWLTKAQLAKYFLSSTELITHMTADELKHRILEGLQVLQHDAKGLLLWFPNDFAH